MAFNLLENSMWKKPGSNSSAYAWIQSLYLPTRGGISLAGCLATLSVLSMSRGDKTQQKTHRVKRRTRRDMGLSHGWQSFMNFSSRSPSHGLQLFVKCCSTGPFPQGAVLQEQPAPAWDPHWVTILTANLVLCGPPPQGHRFCQEPVSEQTSQTTASFRYPPAPTWNPAQGDPWCTMDLHRLQEHSYPTPGCTMSCTMSCTMGCFGAWSHLLPSCSDLPACFSHMLSWICCLYCAGFFSLISHCSRGTTITTDGPSLSQRQICLGWHQFYQTWERLLESSHSWSSGFSGGENILKCYYSIPGAELAVPIQAVILLPLEVTTSSSTGILKELKSSFRIYSTALLWKTAWKTLKIRLLCY